MYSRQAPSLTSITLCYVILSKMSTRIRISNGRFARKKAEDSKQKKLAAMSAAKRKRISNILCESNENVCEGKRIVDVKVLAKNLRCSKCNERLYLDKVLGEKCTGLNSTLIICCDKCKTINEVRTNKEHECQAQQRIYSDINSAAVLGAVHSGMGCTALNKLLAVMNIPAISNDLYKRYEREVGPAIEKAAKESCRRAAEEERRLVIQNVKRLCEDLPPEIVYDIYPNLEILESSSINNNLNYELDAALLDIVHIIISYDMGWTKRGNGRSYDSLNGYGIIIGFLSGKILDYATRNRKCALCDRGHDKADHDCRKNYHGSAKAMEADAGAQLINHSQVLKDVGLKVRVVIGDEDSSTIAAVRKAKSEVIYKLADKNHLIKNFGKELYELVKSHKELNKKGVIPHLKKCFAYAISQNKGKTAELASAIRSIPDHIYNRHENCGNWCRRGNNSGAQTIQLKDEKLYAALDALFSKYANNARKFSVAASSQANESVNNIIAHKAHKNVCHSKSAAADFRVASAVCTKNDGEASILYIKKKLQLSPGTHTAKYAVRYDKRRRARAIKESTKEKKLRRLELVKNREQLRKKMESSEGVTYKSNSGMNVSKCGMNVTLTQTTVTESVSSTYNVIYFDLETGGLSMTDDILQIAAISENREFNVYVNPTQPISPAAMNITGLSIIEGHMHFNNKVVSTIHIKDALITLNQFLSCSEKINVLVAHNAKFDVPRLLRAMVKNNVHLDFTNIVGFVDTLTVFKKAFPERKGPGLFKLSTLAQDILGPDVLENFHNATFDVSVLQKLIKFLKKEDDLLKYMKPYETCLSDQLEYDTIKANLEKLHLLKGVLSRDLLKRMAKQNISFENLKEVYKNGGEEAVYTFCTARCESGKPKITRDKKAINKIITRLIQ